MAFPTAVNDQISDSVSQANLKVLGDAPSMGLSSLFISTSQALSNAAHNSTTFQQQAVLTGQAANVQGLSTLYSVDTSSSGVATTDIDDSAVAGLGSYAKGTNSLTPSQASRMVWIPGHYSANGTWNAGHYDRGR